MASLKIYDMTGADLGVIEMDDAIFAVDPNETLVHEVVLALQNAKRQGTHKTKDRGEVRGGGAKPFRQKGTGRSRQGSSREPQMRGGGTIFGPVPRSYRQRVSTRAKRQALCCALSERLRGERLSVVRGMRFDAPKTKPVAEMLDKLAPEGRKTLLVTSGNDDNLLLSGRNIARLTMSAAADINVLDVLNAARVVVAEEALQTLKERLS
jgi:large subunit ribosomal protein L4